MRFPVTKTAQEELDDQDLRIIRVTTENIGDVRIPKNALIPASGSNPPPAQGRYSYRVGPGDQLQIDFYADPARVTASGEDTPRTTPVIDEAGTFFYPFIGQVRASGRTVGQIREDLVTRLEEFFATPQVDVSVIAFNARKATVTGEVGAQGSIPLSNVPLSLMEVINTVGVADGADLSRIQLRRGGRQYQVNLKGFLEAGIARGNPVILDGDLIRVPPRKDDKIFTFGEINVGELQLGETDKTLVEVLAESGGIDRLRADARGIFVFRREDPTRTGFDVYQFDLSSAPALILAAEFQMAPLDIVFVTNDPATRWADTVGKIVQPFDSLVRARGTVDGLSGSDNDT